MRPPHSLGVFRAALSLSLYLYLFSRFSLDFSLSHFFSRFPAAYLSPTLPYLRPYPQGRISLYRGVRGSPSLSPAIQERRGATTGGQPPTRAGTRQCAVHTRAYARPSRLSRAALAHRSSTVHARATVGRISARRCTIPSSAWVYADGGGAGFSTPVETRFHECTFPRRASRVPCRSSRPLTYPLEYSVLEHWNARRLTNLRLLATPGSAFP